MNQIQNFVDVLMGNPTCTAAIMSFDLKHPDCFKLAISKSLSLGIVLGALVVKVPQILSILRAQSVKGISLSSILLEQVSIIIAFCYNLRKGNPFSTYGEGAFMALQNAFIVMLIMQFTKRRFTGIFINILSFVAVAALNSIKMEFLNFLMLGTIGLGIASKLPQIYSNFSAKSTGQLSFLTTFLQFGGTVARVLTTLQEVDDFGVLLSFIVAATLNGIILAQIVLYGRQKSSVKVVPATSKKKR